jgi:predicted Fe-Mo cluster-binding NifX family protein
MIIGQQEVQGYHSSMKSLWDASFKTGGFFMKLCVTSTGRDLDSKVDFHFGKAPYLLIVDTDTMDCEVVENTAQITGKGAGVNATQLILDKGAAAVLTGIIGPYAFEALKFAHVDIYEGLSGSDTVRDAVEKFQKGAYRESLEPSGGIGRGRGFRGGRWEDLDSVTMNTGKEIATYSLIINIILTATKMFLVLFSGSMAVLSEAVHSLTW